MSIYQKLLNWLYPLGDLNRSYRHNCPVMRAIERRCRKWLHKTAPPEGIILINKEIMKCTELWSEDKDEEANS